MKKALVQSAKRTLLITLALVTLFSSASLAAIKYTTLEFGSRGADVLKLQQALLALGFNPNGTDGKFGRGTENAVVAYQDSKNLTADGKAGTQTLTALYADFEALSASGSSSSDSSSTSSGSSDSPNTLKYGDSGSRVTEMQTALVKLGYSTNGVDGRFGAGTQRAVIAFQKANKLTADGLAGTKTLELLYKLADKAGDSSSSDSGSTGSTSSLSRTLRKGYTGDDVKQVQQQLKALGYYNGSIDGVYGTGSMAAVQAFQKRNGLTADGLAGTQTFNKLFSSSAVAAGDSSGSSSSSGSDNGSSSSGSGSSTYVTLRVGSTGSDVKRLQQALKDLNYSVGSVDGVYGNGTADAVTAFQKRNSLTADGVAGAFTQSKLYSGSAKAADSSSDSSGSSSGGSSSDGPSSSGDSDAGKADGPSTSQVKLLHWFNEVKPSIKAGQYITIFDPATNLQWTLRLYSLGRHADSEPKTQADTDIMFKAFGYTNTWTPKPVYVKLPSGTWTLASMHNVPHLTGSIKDNGFDGHLCVHFLRDMDECKLNDPNYGVTNQNVIRQKWKQMTGETVD